MREHAQPLRIGILGAARIARRAIIEPAKQRNDVEVTCVASRDQERGRQFASRYEIPRVAKNYDDVVCDDSVDLVYVALPPAFHAEWSIKALLKGKAVLCEKPCALTAAETEEVVRCAKEMNGIFLEAFHYRFHPAVLRAIKIAQGSLGQLIEGTLIFHGRIPYEQGELRWRPDLGGGALLDFGCYPVHILRTITGQEPSIIESSMEMQHGVDAKVSAVLKFPRGLTAGISCSMVEDKTDLSLRLRGTKGELIVSNYVVPHFGCDVTATGDEVVTERYEGPPSYDYQLDHIVDVLLRNAKPLTGGRDAVDNMSALDKIAACATRLGVS